ncbi:MAG: hypothetical protein R3A13_03205 [Bdellovibrionota bacterium]
MSAVAGSAKIGSGVVLGGQAGVADRLLLPMEFVWLLRVEPLVA